MTHFICLTCLIDWILVVGQIVSGEGKGEAESPVKFIRAVYKSGLFTPHSSEQYNILSKRSVKFKIDTDNQML